MSYAFDKVFTAFSTQEEVFEETLRPIFGDVLNGFESTIFAYGQTGTGKSYTMEGDLSKDEMHGVIPRSAAAIFTSLKQGKEYTEHCVRCTYLEIYNEELADLLLPGDTDNDNKKNNKLEIIMGGKNGPYCRGLSEKVVESPEDVLELMKTAHQHRQIGETKMNKSSSRSHCIFTLKVKAKKDLKDGSGELEFNGKLHLVDLAGSECAKTAALVKSGSSESTRERERMNINRSLLTLGRVLSMLKERSENSKKANLRIPYRDSKLTRILQESLGGRCKTIIIATLSPSVTAIEESISTLNYAQSANGIVNKPIATSKLSLKSVAKTYMALSALKSASSKSAELSAHENFSSPDDWNELEIRLQYMQVQVEEAQGALARKHVLQTEAEEKAEAGEKAMLVKEELFEKQHSHIGSLESSLEKQGNELKDTKGELAATLLLLTAQTARAEKAELKCQNLEEKLESAESIIQELEQNLKEEIGMKEDALMRLTDTSIELKKTRAVLSDTQQTESSLTSEAGILLSTLMKSLVDGDSLHTLLLAHRDEEIDRRCETRKFAESQYECLDGTLACLVSLSEKAVTLCGSLQEGAENNDAKEHESISQTEELFKLMSAELNDIITTMRDQLTGNEGVVTVLDTSTSEAVTGLEKASDIVIDAEDGLTQAFGFLRASLAEHSARIGEMWNVHDAHSDTALSSIQNNVKDITNKLIYMADSTNKSIVAAQKKQKEHRELQSAQITQWESSSLETSENISNTSQICCESVTSSLDTFKVEMHNHDDIDKLLAGQRSLLASSGDAHKVSINQQRRNLNEQRESYIDDKKKLNSMSEAFVKNLMVGVQSLVDEQTKLLRDENSRHFDFCIEKNELMTERNGTCAQSATSIIEEISSVNSSLIEKGKSVKRNDLIAAETMESARKTLDDLKDTSRSHSTATSEFARKVEDSIKELSALDLEADSIVSKLSGDKKDCVDQLNQSLLTKTEDTIHLLASTGRDLANYGSSVIVPECSAALDGVEMPRASKIHNFKSTHQEIKEGLESCQKEIGRIAEEQCAKTVEIRTYVRAKQDYHTDSIGKVRKAELDTYRENLTTHSREYQTTTTGSLSGCSHSLESVKIEMEDFILKTIKAREDVNPVEERKEFEYEEKFSATLEDALIHEKLDFTEEIAISAVA